MTRARRLPADRWMPLALIAFALFLRVLVPAGWMPVEGQIGIRPCLPPATSEAAAHPAPTHTGHHAAQPHHQPPQAPDEQQHGQPSACTFGMLAAALLAPPLTGDDIVAADYAQAPPSSRDLKARLGRALAAPPPPATGPPASA